MGNIKSDVLTGANIGGTSGTFDNAGNVLLEKDVKALRAVMISAASLADTAGDVVQGRVRLRSSLFREDWEHNCPPYNGGHPANNIGIRYSYAEMIPCYAKAKGGERIFADFTHYTPDVPSSADFKIAFIYEMNDGFPSPELSAPTPPDYMFRGPLAQSHPFGAVWKDSHHPAIVGAGETDSTISIDVPNWADMIVGANVGALPDAMEVVEWVASVHLKPTFSHSTPLKYVLPAVGPGLGTPVGRGVDAAFSQCLPVWQKIRKGGGETISVTYDASDAQATGSYTAYTAVQFADSDEMIPA